MKSSWDRSSQVGLGQVKSGLLKSKNFWTKDCLGPKVVLIQNFVGPKNNLDLDQVKLSKDRSSQIRTGQVKSEIVLDPIFLSLFFSLNL